MIRIALATGSFLSTQPIAQRLGLAHGSWVYLHSPELTRALRGTLVLIDETRLLAEHPHGAAVLAELLTLSTRGAIVLARTDTPSTRIDAAHLPHTQ